jgi:hypothetical protein
MDDPKEIEALATNFFKDLYSRDHDINADDLISLLYQPIIEEMNKTLCIEFSDEEVGDALFQIGPVKAPGPNGLTGCFFQRNWALMKKDVIDAVKDFFSSGRKGSTTQQLS